MTSHLFFIQWQAIHHEIREPEEGEELDNSQRDDEASYSSDSTALLHQPHVICNGCSSKTITTRNGRIKFKEKIHVYDDTREHEMIDDGMHNDLIAEFSMTRQDPHERQDIKDPQDNADLSGNPTSENCLKGKPNDPKQTNKRKETNKRTSKQTNKQTNHIKPPTKRMNKKTNKQTIKQQKTKRKTKRFNFNFGSCCLF